MSKDEQIPPQIDIVKVLGQLNSSIDRQLGQEINFTPLSATEKLEGKNKQYLFNYRFNDIFDREKFKNYYPHFDITTDKDDSLVLTITLTLNDIKELFPDWRKQLTMKQSYFFKALDKTAPGEIDTSINPSNSKRSGK